MLEGYFVGTELSCPAYARSSSYLASLWVRGRNHSAPFLPLSKYDSCLEHQWISFFLPGNLWAFNLQDWLLDQIILYLNDEDKLYLFIAMLWSIWKQRNQLIFSNSAFNSDVVFAISRLQSGIGYPSLSSTSPTRILLLLLNHTLYAALHRRRVFFMLIEHGGKVIPGAA